MNNRKKINLSSLPPICPFKEAAVNAILSGRKILDAKKFFQEMGLSQLPTPSTGTSQYIRRASESDLQEFDSILPALIN